MTHDAIATINQIMTNGFYKSGLKIPTQNRCEYCTNNCSLIPETCEKYQWDYEMSAEVLNDNWEV